MVLDHADSPRRLIVERVTLRDFRSYERLVVDLAPGLVLVTGANGAGKTNLLESLHVGTQGFSPRSRRDAQLIRTGAERTRITLRGQRGGAAVSVEVTAGLSEVKRARLNGAQLGSAEELRRQLATLVFIPDRLAVVKGSPAVRRAYLDRVLARLLPSRAAIPLEYAAALGQRNAALRRAAGGLSSRDTIAPWTSQVARLAAALVDARRETVALLSSGFAECGERLALPAASLEYDSEPPTTELLESRLERDLARGTTSVGPHLDDVLVHSSGRDLRMFGSQGEQRTAVLALLLAEAELLQDRDGSPPLVLLDDALSELDVARRATLATWLSSFGQAIVTATSADALPLEPAQVLEVTPGHVREGER